MTVSVPYNILVIILSCVISLLMFAFLHEDESSVDGVNFGYTNTMNWTISCYENTEMTLPELATSNPHWEKSIYFLEVSCRSEQNGKITLLPREACAMESAAFNNPNFDVHVLYTSSAGIKNEGSISDKLLQILLSYDNVKILGLDFKKLIKNSSAEVLYGKDQIQDASFPLIVASDVARLLVMQKYGGIYLDTDVIVVKPLKQLGINYVGITDDKYVNNAVMNIKPGTIGSDFAQLSLDTLTKDFRGDIWQHTGPVIITKALKQICKIDTVSELSNKNCSGFKIYPRELFYHYTFQNWSMYFTDQKSGDELDRILENSYVVHLWNKYSREFRASTHPNSIYNSLAKRFCPRVFKEAGKYL